MYRISGTHFGVFVEPGPTETDRNVPVTFQIVTGSSADPDSWRGLGPKFPAEHLEDLLQQLNKAKKLLDDQFEKKPEGYQTRRVFF